MSGHAHGGDNHGHDDHGGGGSINTIILCFFGMVVLIALCGLFYKTGEGNERERHLPNYTAMAEQSAPPQQAQAVEQPAAPQPIPAPGPQPRTNPDDWVIRTYDGQQIDARAGWTELSIVGVASRHLKLEADPNAKTCSAPNMPCGGPDGWGDTVPDFRKFQLFVLHNSTARFYELIGRWGNGEPFILGSRYDGVIPTEAHGQHLQVMPNVENVQDHLDWNRGGPRIISAEVY